MENTIFNVKAHHRWPFTIAMLNYQRVMNYTAAMVNGYEKIGIQKGFFPAKTSLGIECRWIGGKFPDHFSMM